MKVCKLKYEMYGYVITTNIKIIGFKTDFFLSYHQRYKEDAIRFKYFNNLKTCSGILDKVIAEDK